MGTAEMECPRTQWGPENHTGNARPVQLRRLGCFTTEARACCAEVAFGYEGWKDTENDNDGNDHYGTASTT
ncbi:MAG: hypothetical protein R6V05_12615 [Candidatus Brocadiia bacterium]